MSSVFSATIHRRGKRFTACNPGKGRSESRVLGPGFPKFSTKSPPSTLLCQPGCSLRKGGEGGFPLRQPETQAPRPLNLVRFCCASPSRGQGNIALLSPLPTSRSKLEKVSSSGTVAFWAPDWPRNHGDPDVTAPGISALGARRVRRAEVAVTLGSPLPLLW